MVEKRIYLKEWRKHRGYTQKQVADWLASLDDELLPRTEASLSRIETKQQPYSQRILEALAEKYECDPWELIGRHPGKEGHVVDLMARLKPDQRIRAEAVLEAMFKSEVVGE